MSLYIIHGWIQSISGRVPILRAQPRPIKIQKVDFRAFIVVMRPSDLAFGFLAPKIVTPYNVYKWNDEFDVIHYDVIWTLFIVTFMMTSFDFSPGCAMNFRITEVAAYRHCRLRMKWIPQNVPRIVFRRITRHLYSTVWLRVYIRLYVSFPNSPLAHIVIVAHPLCTALIACSCISARPMAAYMEYI